MSPYPATDKIMSSLRKAPTQAIPLILVLALGHIGPGCKSGSGQNAAGQAIVSDSVSLPVSAAEKPAESFDLLKYSALDTASGVFEGEYEEKVNEKITVKARVRVHLENRKITGIDLLDTCWVNPAAARLIPQRIIESQRLPVEAVSGASVASWTLMTATAVALQIDLTELDDSSGGTSDR